MQFPLLRAKDNPAMGIILPGLAGISGVIGLVTMVLSLVGAMPWRITAVLAAMLVVYLFSMLWLLTKTSDGYAEITQSHLLIKRKHGDNERYRLDDIRDARLEWAWWGRLPYVELQFRRSLMLGVRSAYLGTDIAGIPTLFWKRASILVKDTESFAEELRRRLPPPEG